jgi:nucleoid-associated protein YgaU
MADVIEAARITGFQRCLLAHQRIAGLGPPPPDGRPDPMELHRIRARRAAERIFNVQDPDMDKVARIVGQMKNWLASPSLKTVKADPKDKNCGFRSAFVINNRPPIHLCPQFFATTDEMRARTMIHEAAHLTGIGDGEGECYYNRFNCQSEDPEITHGTPHDVSRVAQADTWAKYVHCVCGLSPDRVDVITPGDPPAEPKVHVVKYGDYLVKLAQEYYGDGKLWKKIYDTNRAVIGPNPDKIYPGQVLTIP